MILNSLMIEFILTLDEYLADSPRHDRNFRYLRCAAAEMLVRLHLPKAFLKRLKLKDATDATEPSTRPRPKAKGGDDAGGAVGASLDEYFGEGPAVHRYGLLARFLQGRGLGTSHKGIFNRYAGYRTPDALLRWNEILFADRSLEPSVDGDGTWHVVWHRDVPYAVLEGFEALPRFRKLIERCAPSLAAKISRAPHLGDVLKTASCQRIWSAFRGYNGDGEPLIGISPLRRVLVVLDACAECGSAFILLFAFPVTAIAVAVWVPLCYGP